MQAELEKLIANFEAELRHLERLSASASEEEWARRPADGGWSAAECVAHLNLTGVAYRPLLREGVERAKRLGGRAPKRLRKDLLGWLILKSVGPNRRFKSKTPPAFIPDEAAPKKELVAEFATLQAEQIAIVRECAGLPIDKVKIASPFDPRGKYSLYSALVILPAHQERHLIQAEEALGKRAG